MVGEEVKGGCSSGVSAVVAVLLLVSLTVVSASILYLSLIHI